MRCPKCEGDMERVRHADIEVDRCETCKGIWFDALEKDDLLRLDGAEAIDIGSSTRGQRFDALRDVDCPRCKQKMVTRSDKQQPHIHYEVCPNCTGAFFDSGEFRDLKDFNILERISALVRFLRQSG